MNRCNGKRRYIPLTKGGVITGGLGKLDRYLFLRMDLGIISADEVH
jgi:hypothetical protein